MDFLTVFDNVALPENVKSVFADAAVKNVLVRRADKTMSVELELPRFIDEGAVFALSNGIRQKFPLLNNVNINFKYIFGDNDGEKITKYWDKIVSEVRNKSQLCGEILRRAAREYSDGVLSVRIMKNGTHIFRQKEIHKMIERLVLERLSVNLRVEFTELEKPLEIVGGEVYREAVERVVNVPTKTVPDRPQKRSGGSKGLKILPEIVGIVTELSEDFEETEKIIISGVIFSSDTRDLKSGKTLVILEVYDGTDSIQVKMFVDSEKYNNELKKMCKKGERVTVSGVVQFDTFSKEINLMAREIAPAKPENCLRRDTHEGQKRVELHLHTRMSKMDAVTSAKDIVARVGEWGQTAVGITDHGVVQAFPEAFEAAKKAGIKVLYGCECYLIDDYNALVKSPRKITFFDAFVVFDIETTGLDSVRDKIIEIGAVKVENGEITETFSALVNPEMLLPGKIVELTKITDDMLHSQPKIDEVLPRFLEFVGNCAVVAHNAKFDTGFIRQKAKDVGLKFRNTIFCTLEASRVLLPQMNTHRLDRVCAELGVTLNNHHRAVDDATATANVFIKLKEMFLEKGVQTMAEVNDFARVNSDLKKVEYYHAVIFAKNVQGLRNLYELISRSHLEHFYKKPRIPKSLLEKLRDGLIIGTACEAGEFFKAVLRGAEEEVVDELAEFYDYFEIQPIANNEFLVRTEQVHSRDELREINKKIVELGEKYNKPVVATCDVHFLDPEDMILRKIILSGEKFTDGLETPLFLRTTDEMLEEFSYLGAEKAEEVVITNTNLIADMCNVDRPIPKGTFPPVIDGAEEEVRKIAVRRAKDVYGDPLPKAVNDRLERELHSITSNGFAVMYVIARKLVLNSNENGYLVGSRGSVGSSFAATMCGITEVNPLPPHYYCSCGYCDFDSEEVRGFAGASGYDMPDKACPNCGASLKKDGHDIPFETFLGFNGDKEPDIDLNFSGEYQSKAHAYVEELLGKGLVFRAGTIGALADKTAFGFVKKFYEQQGIVKRNAEMNRLVQSLTGIKRTTGQHPGGMVVVPEGHSVYEFTPIQRPADSTDSEVVTTHFEFHEVLEGHLLKLDILGHDAPTIIRMLHDLTGIDPCTVDLGDKDVISLFTSPEKLGVYSYDIGCDTGSLGLPEFGTNFVRQMLVETKPSTFAELVRISGLSHGTNVWTNNAQELIKDRVCTLKEVIPTRDDIMLFLIQNGVESLTAFKIMENVRKGKGLTEEEVKTLKNAKVANWYIESCKKIEYLFPKGHAVAYVTMTFRIGYFKIHYPLAFYAATFSVKSGDFDYETMCKGKEVAKKEIARIEELGKEATPKDKSLISTLELVVEMYARGLCFVPLDLYKSHTDRFLVTEKGLLPPLCAVSGLGGAVAQNIAEERKKAPFLSIKELKERTKVNKTVVELLKANNILAGLPEDDQLSLFDFAAQGG